MSKQKEIVIQLLQEAGIDTITACEEYERIKTEFLDSKKDKQTIYIKNGRQFTLKRINNS